MTIEKLTVQDWRRIRIVARWVFDPYVAAMQGRCLNIMRQMLEFVLHRTAGFKQFRETITQQEFEVGNVRYFYAGLPNFSKSGFYTARRRLIANGILKSSDKNNIYALDLPKIINYAIVRLQDEKQTKTNGHDEFIIQLVELRKKIRKVLKQEAQALALKKMKTEDINNENKKRKSKKQAQLEQTAYKRPFNLAEFKRTMAKLAKEHDITLGRYSGYKDDARAKALLKYIVSLDLDPRQVITTLVTRWDVISLLIEDRFGKPVKAENDHISFDMLFLNSEQIVNTIRKLLRKKQAKQADDNVVSIERFLRER